MSLSFIIGDWNAKVGSQDTPGITGKFGLGVRNEAEQRLIVFCQENALVIANTLPFTWGQTVVEVMKMMVTSLKRSHACAVTLSAPNPAAGHHHPTPPPETQTPTGKSPVGSLFLSPGSWCTRFCCALQESFPQS